MVVYSTVFHETQNCSTALRADYPSRDVHTTVKEYTK